MTAFRLRPALASALLGAAVLACAPVAAQPAADVLLRAWAEGQERALRASPVVLAEDVERVVEGPRGDIVMNHRGTVRYAPGEPPEREVERVVVDGREVPAERGGAVRRRLGRAFGPAGREVEGPPPPALAAIGAAEPAGPVAADRVEGRGAWRVPLRLGRRGRGEAWFSSGPEPRLLRARLEAGFRGGRVSRVTDYARHGGLDLPREVRTTATVRQRRRLRDYVVTVRSVGRYAPVEARGRR